MKLFKVSEVAKIFGVSKQTCHNWISAGKLNTTATPGGEVRIEESEIERIIKVGRKLKKR